MIIYLIWYNCKKFAYIIPYRVKITKTKKPPQKGGFNDNNNSKFKSMVTKAMQIYKKITKNKK